jgi:hypothetical protein
MFNNNEGARPMLRYVKQAMDDSKVEFETTAETPNVFEAQTYDKRFGFLYRKGSSTVTCWDNRSAKQSKLTIYRAEQFINEPKQFDKWGV